MKFAVSNIGWAQHDDAGVLGMLRESGVQGIEVAPTKIWPDWKQASFQQAQQYKESMLDNGFEIPAMQAILFGKPELQVFDASTHAEFLEHTRRVAELANGLGAKVLVFGAPKNKKRGQMPYQQAFDMAADFFYKMADICLSQACCIGLEHNPVEYGCDFITNMLDARELVDRVDHQGFKLHIDSAGLHMCGGEITESLGKAGQFVHYHISEPMLEPVFEGVVDHMAALKTLKTGGYDQWVSIEMKQPEHDEQLTRSVELVSSLLKKL